MAGEFRKYAKQAFRQMDAGPPAHPGTERIAAYVNRQLAGDQRAEIEKHLAGCAACRECAGELELFLADAAGAAQLPPAELDAEYRKLERRLPQRRVISMPTRWMAIAAGVVLALGAGAALYRLASPSTPKLLAEAYRERRSSELRIAGAGYSELRQERAGGSAFTLPAPLLKAQAQIKDELQAHASDPALLRLEGEAQMVGGDAAGAVEALRRAHELSAHDAKTMADLGAAYAMLGDAEHDYGDYQKAIDFLEQSIRADGSDAEPKFNRAVTLEKLMLYSEAETAWEAYLKADPASGWAAEARKRLEAVREKLRQRQKQLGQVRDDPDYFSTLADANGADAEAWLISSVSTRWLAHSAADSKARAAVVKLAALLARDHGDRWLQDMTAAACTSGEAAAALAGLMPADDLANRGQYAAALDDEEKVARAFERAGCKAGAWRTRLSQVVALHNSVQTEDCLSNARRLSVELAVQAYIRLRARVTRELAICATQLGRLEEADTALREALAMARAAHYGATTLELANQELDSTRRFGMPSQTVAQAEESLRVFWSGAYAGSASLLPLSELRQAAGASGLTWAALDFARAKLWAVSGPDGIPILKAPAYHDLGVAERETGDAEAARLDFESSSRIAQTIPTQYRIPPAAALARLDLARGDAGTALERLAPFAQLAPTLPWSNRAIYYTALGEALERKGDIAGALAAFRSVADSASTYLATLNRDDERGSVLKAVESTYRGMVAALLATPGNEATALQTWRAFRDFDAPPGVREAAPAVDATLWFVELPDGFAAWFTRAGETRFHRLTASKPALTEAARRFLEECGSPLSSAAALRAEGRELYRWMIEPFAADLARLVAPAVLPPVLGNLTFELDGSLASLPMSALVAGDGSYLGDRFTTLISSGRLRRKYTGPGPNAKVLIVANPAIAGRSAARFPPLPQSVRETEAIRGRFASSEILEGRSATLNALAEALPRAEIVHFAGHGYSSSGYGGLLLAPADAAAADYQLLRASEMSTMDWSRCSLAALSACAAAEGETHGAHNPESLIRALTKAGAPRIAASLWNVDSAAAAELMSRFYLGLSNGAGVAESFRAARQAVRGDARWSHPYYWAGFQLYGAT